MAWVDQVLAAMGFGVVFRSWIATLHRDAAATFLLNIISRPVPVNFSIRQGDPLSSILFIIYIEPFLKQLERELVGLFMAGGREVGFGYMDDVEIISGDIRDLHLVDVLCRRFEAAAGAILNRNRKTVILGLGSWAGRLVWPLPWIRAASPVKVLGFNIAADLASTQQATWDRVLAAVRSTVGGFSSRLLPTLRQKVDVIITFALSRVWYFCQVLAMPPEVAADIRRCISSYLWKGRTERLAFDELHSPREKGGLGLPCIQTRAEALFTKQYAQFVAAGGRMAAHVAFWLGPQLHHLVPYLPVLPPPPPPPQPLRGPPPTFGGGSRRPGGRSCACPLHFSHVVSGLDFRPPPSKGGVPPTSPALETSVAAAGVPVAVLAAARHPLQPSS